MANGGMLGDVLGSGPGRGIGLMFALAGTLVTVTAIVAWKSPRIKNLDTEIPDIEEQHAAA